MIVKVMSQKNAIEYSKTVNNKCVIVSITAPLSENPDMELPVFANNLNILDVFRMQFNDYTYKVNELSIPERKDFIGLKDFIDKYRDEVDEIIVHCAAGVSRSAGCAVALSQYLSIEDNISNNERYKPNRLVYRLAIYELFQYNFGDGFK